MRTLLEKVKIAEGFRSKPYQDSLKVWTFGHGLTEISEEESSRIVGERLDKLQAKWIDKHPWISDRSPLLLDVITEMSYQLGFAGTLGFKRMWKALKTNQYVLAHDEMLDSRWAIQSPNRAKRLANVVRLL